ncbi:MAG: hypothetical protein DHS20C14_12050 [Phycisphaeraceae bacterium]|nr:MAG: hypothetical protein DHS20C14_12050 [Phycisphaeraceae bacterium]
MSETPSKPCVVCGGECAGKPRVKDATGRYMHQSCAKALKQDRARGPDASASAPKKPSRKTPASAEGMMDYLIEDAMEAAPEPCPNCTRARAKNAIICVHCGYNPATGKAVKTRIEKLQKEKGDKTSARRSGGLPVAVSPTSATIFGVFIFGGLAALGIAVHPGFFWVYLVVWAFFFTLSWAWSVMAAFQDGEPGWGITLIIAPFICLGWLLNYYYVWVESGRDNLKACYSISLVAAIAMWVMIHFSMWAVMGSALGTTTGPTPGTLAAMAAANQNEEYIPPDAVLYESSSPRQRGDAILLDIVTDIQFSRMSAGVPMTRNEEDQLEDFGAGLESYPTFLLIQAQEHWESLGRDERDEIRSYLFYDYDPEMGSTAQTEDFTGAALRTHAIYWVGRAAMDEARPGENPIAVNAMIMMYISSTYNEEFDEFIPTMNRRTRDLDELAERGINRAREKIAALSDEDRARTLHYVMAGAWPEDDYGFQPPSQNTTDGSPGYAVGTGRNDEDLAAALTEMGIEEGQSTSDGSEWTPGSLSSLIGAPATPWYTPTGTTSFASRPGEQPEMVERALWQGAHWYLKAQTDLDTAFATLEKAKSIEDYPQDVRSAVVEIFEILTDEDRAALLAYVQTGGVLSNAGEIEGAFAP